jgi:L-ascorbate metabolism protein UlaG (beta-lactamase superfamily)
MQRIVLGLSAIAVTALSVAVQPAFAQNVKITPLGSHDGEFCRLDRALVFEDPDGTRILYDAGRTVSGPDDPRLGNIDAVLLSHVHGDHVGDRHISAVNQGACGAPEFPVVSVPNSNSVDIVMGKNARFIVGAEMASFFSAKIKKLGGDPKLVQLLRYGAMREVGGVKIASVPAVHSNGLNAAFLDSDYAAALKASGLTAYIGPPGGYILQFSNGLVAYLSGDTGLTAEQDLVVRRFYKSNLAVINIGGTFTTGPQEAAYVINEMVKPASVIASHANEAATDGGNIVAGTRTETFANAVKVPLHLPLSGWTMEFTGKGKCMAGC